MVAKELSGKCGLFHKKLLANLSISFCRVVMSNKETNKYTNIYFVRYRLLVIV